MGVPPIVSSTKARSVLAAYDNQTLCRPLDEEFAHGAAGYFAALIAAQRFFWASAIFRFVAALKPFRFFGGVTTPATGVSIVTATAAGFFGGRPRRLAGDEPCNASIARLSLSRS